MNIKFLRASSINSYKGCEFQFFMEQILELPSKGGKKALLGTIVHHVLELMAKGKKVNRNFGLITDHVRLLEICWKRYQKENPHYELKPADRKFCLQSIEKVLGTQYDPRNLNVICTEKQFRIPMVLDGFKYDYYDIESGTRSTGNYELRGTIDLITKIDNNTLEIVDWKTGSRKCWNTGTVKEYDYLYSEDIQLRMYDLACSIVYPEYKNRLLTIHYINDGGPFTVSFDDNDRIETISRIKKVFDSVKWNQLPSRIKETKSSDKWKCKSVCHFGKTMTSAGCSICDTIHSFMVGNGIDATIEQIDKLKKQNASEKLKSASNRRNNFDE